VFFTSIKAPTEYSGYRFFYSDFEVIVTESFSYLWENNSIQTTMKNFCLLLSFALFLSLIHPNQSNAQQWYNSFGVTNINELTEAQCKVAMEKATKLIGTGTAFAIIGGLAAIVGGIVYYSGLTSIMTGSYNEITKNTQNAMIGGVIMYCGAGLSAIGIPLWIAGAMRKADIEIALAKFPAKVAFGPRIIKDLNHYSLGLSMSITF